MTELRTRPSTKDELLRETRKRWAAFITFTDNQPEALWTGPTDAAGWTMKDHVAHVTAWDHAVIELLRHHTPTQRTLNVSDAAWTAGGFDAMNEEIRQQTLDQPVDAVRTRRDAIFAELMELLEGYSDDALAKPAKDTGLTKGEASLLETFDEYFPQHYDEHLGYIQRIVTGSEEIGNRK